ncbi:MAG: hypothetical protein J6T30_02910, partial [Bacteroidales bacterium]|nr:hypothetical protein [Bacteroidales bacterium]
MPQPSPTYFDKANNRPMLLLYISIILVIVFLQQEYVAIPQIIEMSAYDGATKAKVENQIPFRTEPCGTTRRHSQGRYISAEK